MSTLNDVTNSNELPLYLSLRYMKLSATRQENEVLATELPEIGP